MSQHELDDAVLVEQARNAARGDFRPFHELIRRHEARVLANCRYLSGSETDAEDLAQEVFVKAYFGLARFEGRAQFGTWVQRIKINHCLNHLRSRKKLEGSVDIDDPVHEIHPEMQVTPRAESELARRDRREQIRSVLDQIPATLRVPLVMRDLDGLSYQEIAKSLGIGLSAVKMRIKRGREEFRKRFPVAETAEESPA